MEKCKSRDLESPYRLVVNRMRAEELAQIWEECNDLLPELDKMKKTLRKVMRVAGRLSGEMYEGTVVECKEKRSRQNDCY